jgi:hypothetical protein
MGFAMTQRAQHAGWRRIPVRTGCVVEEKCDELSSLPRLAAGLLLLMLVCLFDGSIVHAQSFSARQSELFRQARSSKDDLARYLLLSKRASELKGADNLFAMQLVAFSENELGLYSEAVRDFPLASSEVPHFRLPSREDWQAVPAVAAVTELAQSAQVVLVNEAHHDAHTRELTLSLLPSLHRLGYRYFAVEALVESGVSLQARGYPLSSSGTEYLREPIYGELVRTALALGYTVIAYDPAINDGRQREAVQARTIVDRIFADDPRAKLLVHAGYAHIDRAKGRLGNQTPMAAILAELTGAKLVSVDQTQFREQFPAIGTQYEALVKAFPPNGPVALKRKHGEGYWSAAPELYDLNVLLPPTAGNALTSGMVEPSVIVTDTNRGLPVLARIANAQRPSWLSLSGARRRYVVYSSVCKRRFPCLVEARYTKEGPDAVAADRYVFRHDDSRTVLYLRPGRYALSVKSAGGSRPSQSEIVVGK